jgi:hypothetical protein
MSIHWHLVSFSPRFALRCLSQMLAGGPADQSFPTNPRKRGVWREPTADPFHLRTGIRHVTCGRRQLLPPLFLFPFPQRVSHTPLFTFLRYPYPFDLTGAFSL